MGKTKYIARLSPFHPFCCLHLVSSTSISSLLTGLPACVKPLPLPICSQHNNQSVPLKLSDPVPPAQNPQVAPSATQNKSQRPFMAYPSLVTSLIWFTVYSTHMGLLASSWKFQARSLLLGLYTGCSLCLDHSLPHLFWMSPSQLGLLWPPYFKLQCTQSLLLSCTFCFIALFSTP